MVISERIPYLMYLRIKDAHAVLLTFTQYARYMCIYIYIYQACLYGDRGMMIIHT